MIELADLKLALRLDPDATTEDDYLEALEAAAVAHVERATGRYFGPVVERTEYLRGDGRQEIYLQEEPAATGASPAVVIAVTSDGEDVSGDDYEVRGRILRHTSAWGLALYPTDLVVIYDAGYEAGEEPADIRQAVTTLVAHWYEFRIPVALGTVAPEVAFTLREMLAPWKRWTA